MRCLRVVEETRRASESGPENNQRDSRSGKGIRNRGNRRAQQRTAADHDKVGVVCGDELELEAEVPGGLIEDLLHAPAKEIVAGGAVAVPAEQPDATGAPRFSTAPTSSHETPVPENLSCPARATADPARYDTHDASKGTHFIPRAKVFEAYLPSPLTAVRIPNIRSAACVIVSSEMTLSRPSRAILWRFSGWLR